MPIVEYECPNGHVTETLIGMTADSEELAVCHCGEPVKRIISPSVQLGRDSLVTPQEELLHHRNKVDIEKAHAAGTMLDYKYGKKTPLEYQPAFPKTIY